MTSSDPTLVIRIQKKKKAEEKKSGILKKSRPKTA
jgi:hypothetical protein